jgi:hypothetical protein
MARVSIMGTGTMSSAIGAVVSRGGNTVELFGQGDAARPISGEVVLAVPYGACSRRSSCPGRSWRSCTALPGPPAAGDHLRGRPPRVGRSNWLVAKGQDGRIARPEEGRVQHAACPPRFLSCRAARRPAGRCAGRRGRRPFGLPVVLAAGLLVGELLGPVQRLIAALLAPRRGQR